MSMNVVKVTDGMKRSVELLPNYLLRPDRLEEVLSVEFQGNWSRYTNQE